MNSNTSVPQEYAGRISTSKDWREIVAWVSDLPPMPHVASKAIQLVENPDCTADALSKVLSTDAALAARVLKIANSAMFSRQREITTLDQAIMIIGFKALKGIVVAATLRQMNSNFGAAEKMIWENSMATAMAAHMVARKLKKRYIEEIFLLGLLHNLGQIVFLAQKETCEDFKLVMKRIEEKQQHFAEAEQEVFGFAHPLIGALVAKKWNFSADTCQVILHYKDEIQSKAPENELEEKCAMIQIADSLAHRAEIGNPSGYPDELETVRKLAIFVGFDAQTVDDDLQELTQDLKERFEQERHIYE